MDFRKHRNLFLSFLLIIQYFIFSSASAGPTSLQSNGSVNGANLTSSSPVPTRHFNWPVLEKDKVILVGLKPHLPLSEKNRIIGIMMSMGVTKNTNGAEGWNIKVTNGMSSKGAYEKLKADPAVSFAEPVIITNLETFFASPTPTPTHKPYPTPNWDRLVPGKDYDANQIMVGLKSDIPATDNERVLKLMGSIGDVKHEVLQALKMEYYLIQITNGMSVKDAIEEMKTDPSVKYAEPVGKYHSN